MFSWSQNSHPLQEVQNSGSTKRVRVLQKFKKTFKTRQPEVVPSSLFPVSVFISEMALSSLARNWISVPNICCVPLSTKMKCEWLRSTGLALRIFGPSIRYCAGHRPCSSVKITYKVPCTLNESENDKHQRQVSLSRSLSFVVKAP